MGNNLTKKEIYDLTIALHDELAGLTPDYRINMCYATLCEMDVYFFFRDESKTDLWFETENPNLGRAKPNDLIHVGRAKKLYEFIKSCLNDNKL